MNEIQMFYQFLMNDENTKAAIHKAKADEYKALRDAVPYNFNYFKVDTTDGVYLAYIEDMKDIFLSVDYLRIRGLILKDTGGPWDEMRITRDKIKELKVLDFKDFIVGVYKLKEEDFKFDI
jgi:hypothetical protein